MYSGHSRRRRSFNTRRFIRDISLGLLLLFVIGNGIIWLVYRERTYPRTTVMGTGVGNVQLGALPAKIDNLNLLPPLVQLQKNDKQVTVSSSELGIHKDTIVAAESATAGRSWLPLVNLLATHELAPPIGIDNNKLQTKASELRKTFTADPTNARLAIQDGKAVVQQAQDGYRLNAGRLGATITTALRKGHSQVSVPTDPIPASVQARELQSTADTLNKQLATNISIRYGSTITKPTAQDIASWYSLSDGAPALRTSSILSYLTQVGLNSNIRIKDGQAVADSIAKALKETRDTDIALAAAPTAKTITYCTAAKGVSAAELPALRSKAKSTYADPRGWSANGSIAFKEVTSGCNFTLWLSAADLMPTFGAICDSMWSCRVGPNVVINYERWQHASPAWNEFGGTLEEYRDMVINHETGHWLGFGHNHCPGSGQAAPVMQQQSINLQGCTFNPWPVASELARLRQSLGL